MRALPGWLQVALIIFFGSQTVLAKDVCSAQSTKRDICLCKISDLHPTQASVGMMEVRIKAEKLRDELHRRAIGFFKYLLRHDKEEPVIIGPGGVFYITDHHHLARALYDVGESYDILHYRR